MPDPVNTVDLDDSLLGPDTIVGGVPPRAWAALYGAIVTARALGSIGASTVVDGVKWTAHRDAVYGNRWHIDHLTEFPAVTIDNPNAHVLLTPAGRVWSGRSIPDAAVMVRRDEVRVGDVLCSSHGYMRPVQETHSRGMTTTLTVTLGDSLRGETYDSDTYVPVVRPEPATSEAEERRHRQEARRAMQHHLTAVRDAVEGMLTYWTDHELPDDILAPEEFPFTRSLEDVHGEIVHAVEVLSERLGDSHA